MLTKTGIEYGNFNWNWLRGCANGPEICATSERCWAKGHIAGGASGLSTTKEFYDYINQVLWYSYVDTER